MRTTSGLEVPSLDVVGTQRQIAALDEQTAAQFQNIREVAGTADSSFSFGSRASRPSSGAQGDRYLATDRNCLFYWDGTSWKVIAGIFYGTNATRSAMTVDVSDNGFFFFTNDQNKLWVVTSGAWSDLFTELDVTTAYQVAGNTVVNTRKAGWSTATGTAARTTFATYAGQTITNPPTQAEVQAIDDHLVILSQHMKALIDDLHATAGHGLLGT